MTELAIDGEAGAVYAVVGTWRTEPEMAEVRRQMLDRIVEGVRLAPGIIRGYWADGAGDRSHTFIVFADRASAEAFAEDVRHNSENQARAGVRNEALAIAEIVATT